MNVKGVESPSSGKIAFGKLLVPIDFSEFSKNALNHAIALARQFRSELILIYVVEPTVYPADLGFGQVTIPNFERELEERGAAGLKELARTSVPGELKCRTLVRTGKPFNEIIRLAEEEHVDLIVIATHGHTGVEHLIFGSTAEKVVKKAPCPVLMVRAGGRVSDPGN